MLAYDTVHVCNDSTYVRTNMHMYAIEILMFQNFHLKQITLYIDHKCIVDKGNGSMAFRY